jgi:predicted enzyme related to lactoylglutathione lyase
MNKPFLDGIGWAKKPDLTGAGEPRVTRTDAANAATAATIAPAGQDGGVDVLSSRILLRPADLGRSRHFYRDQLGLAVYREFGSPAHPGVVFFLGPGFLELSGKTPGPPGKSMMIWLQVRDVHAEHQRLAAAGVRVLREPAAEPWGLIEMWIEDPDGVRIVLVEVPDDHPLRRDQRDVSSAAPEPGA